MKNVNWSTAFVVGAILLVLFIAWGALGGWSGGMMGPGWGMMGAGFGSTMALVGLLTWFCFLTALILWVAGNWRKKR